MERFVWVLNNVLVSDGIKWCCPAHAALEGTWEGLTSEGLWPRLSFDMFADAVIWRQRPLDNALTWRQDLGGGERPRHTFSSVKMCNFLSFNILLACAGWWPVLSCWGHVTGGAGHWPLAATWTPGHGNLGLESYPPPSLPSDIAAHLNILEDSISIQQKELWTLLLISMTKNAKIRIFLISPYQFPDLYALL